MREKCTNFKKMSGHPETVTLQMFLYIPLPVGYLIHVIRLIPQWMVDNNLKPDRLAGPKALDPNYCRQPTL